MNLNIQFQISSDTDIIVDQKCKESILLFDLPGADGAGETFGNDLPTLNLGRLKEFYPEAWEQPAAELDGK